MRFEFFVPGQPVGKQRPRMTKSGHTYTPEKTVQYEQLVQACFMAAVGRVDPLQGPLRASVVFRYGVPKSWPLWKREKAVAGNQLPTVKPDLDNAAKGILDALNGYAYKDDAQVAVLDVQKIYSAIPGASVVIENLQQGDEQDGQDGGVLHGGAAAGD